jgi:hypothetical protein
MKQDENSEKLIIFYDKTKTFCKEQLHKFFPVHRPSASLPIFSYPREEKAKKSHLHLVIVITFSPQVILP